MDDKKVNINRPKVTSSEIEEKKDFEQIISQVKCPQNPYFRTFGFWGKTGFAGLALALATQFTIDLISDKKTSPKENTPIAENLDKEKTLSTSCLSPISKENDIPFEVFEIENGKEDSIKLSDGTIINISRDAFPNVPENGIVTIKARIFKDKADAFFAGVPMDYQNDAFESAGMVEIRGFYNDEEIEINSLSPIQVELSLYKHPEKFQFYSLNDSDGKWYEYEADFKTKINEKGKVDDEDIFKLEENLAELEEKSQTLRKEQKLLVYPEESSFFISKNKHLQLDFNFDLTQFKELNKYKNINIEALTNQKNYSSVMKENWNQVEIKKQDEGTYTAHFTNDKHTEILKVRPVLSGDEEIKAIRKFEKAKKDFLSEKSKLSNQLKLLELEKAETQKQIKNLNFKKKKLASLSDEQVDKNIRHKNTAVQQGILSAKAHFTIESWGLYNADRPVAYPNQFKEAIQLVNSDDLSDKVLETFVFDLEKDVRFSFGSGEHKLNEFGLYNNQTLVVVIFESGKIGYTETTKESLEENDGKLDLDIVPKESFSREKMQDLFDGKRFSA